MNILSSIVQLYPKYNTPWRVAYFLRELINVVTVHSLEKEHIPYLYATINKENKHDDRTLYHMKLF